MTATRVGMIGAGGVARRHARVLSGLPEVRLAGVTDVREDAARDLAAEHGSEVFPDVGALLAADPDAVYVCVPPFAHGDAERAVVAAGLPLFVEKPIALNWDTAYEIADLVARRDLITAVGHHWRYLGVVEQARHLAGEVTEVTACGTGTPPPGGGDVDSATAATLRFASGAVGTLAATCVLGWKERAGLEIYADGIALAVTETGLVVRDADGTRTVAADPESAHVAVDRAFIDAVRGAGADVRVPYAEALRTHALALAVAEAATTGGAVRPRTAEVTHA
jgi:myo-inositol 2-dehydrogenase/D-chiro-inositol 1-dehydrogenase